MAFLSVFQHSTIISSHQNSLLLQLLLVHNTLENLTLPNLMSRVFSGYFYECQMAPKMYS